MRGEHSEKCKGDKGIFPGDVTYQEPTEHIDVTAQFKRRLGQLAMENLWKTPMDVYKTVSEEFAANYPPGSIMPTSRQVSSFLTLFGLVTDICLILVWV